VIFLYRRKNNNSNNNKLLSAFGTPQEIGIEKIRGRLYKSLSVPERKAFYVV
jgi:hypothetical protein